MPTYKMNGRRRRLPRRVQLVAVAIIVVLLGGSAFVQYTYNRDLKPVSSSTAPHYITVRAGSSVNTIATQLRDAGLIRSSQAFEWYVSLHNERAKLQAGTYSFTPSESIPEIADAIADGKVATNLVTIVPGQRLDQIRQSFIKAGFAPSAVDNALIAGQYVSAYPVVSDNPPSATLEGFLYPDSYQKTASTDPRQIIGEALTEMQQHLTVDVRNNFATHGLNVYQGVTLASIVEQEVPGSADRAQVAQVFLTRLSRGMMIGSDVTAYYGAIEAGKAPSVNYDSSYNTLLHTGLPPGPISTVSDSSLQAVAHPASTQWLYFVTGDDGVTHYATTLAQHQANVMQYCHTLCNQ